MEFLKRRLTVIVLILSVTFLFLIGYSVKREKSSVLEKGTGITINSVQAFVYKINNNIKESLGFLFDFNEVKRENEILKSKVTELENKIINYDSLKDENERLRSMFNFTTQREQFQYLGADIIGKSGGSFLDGFIINKGIKDGVSKGMIAITGEGLVGQVTSVRSNWAIVQTVVNENIAVSALVESTRESSGIVKGYRGSNDKLLAKLFYLPMDSKIKVGDVILTSGLGGLYPKEIKIGIVKEIEEDKGKLMKNAIVEPYVSFNKLEEVFIVIPKDKRDINYGDE